MVAKAVSFIVKLYHEYFGYRCRNCNGGGWVDVKKWYEPYPPKIECWVCHGTGRVDEDPSGSPKEA